MPQNPNTADLSQHEGTPEQNNSTGYLFEVGTFGVLNRLLCSPSHSQSNVVLQAKEKTTNLMVAAKITNKRHMTHEERKCLLNGVHTLLALKHVNIADFFWLHETDTHVFLFTELAKTTLLACLQQKGRLDSQTTRNLFSQACKAIKYLHSRSIAHRNLKLEHCLLFPNNILKLTGFGFSCKKSNFTGSDLGKIIVTSSHYAPPEYFLLKSEAHDIFAADIWALGVILFAMLRGKMPFRGPTPMRLFTNMHSTCPTSSFRCQRIRSLLNRMLCYDHKTRSCISEIVEDDYVSKSYAWNLKLSWTDVTTEELILEQLSVLGTDSKRVRVALKIKFSPTSGVANVLRAAIRASHSITPLISPVQRMQSEYQNGRNVSQILDSTQSIRAQLSVPPLGESPAMVATSITELRETETHCVDSSWRTSWPRPLSSVEQKLSICPEYSPVVACDECGDSVNCPYIINSTVISGHTTDVPWPNDSSINIGFDVDSDSESDISLLDEDTTQEDVKLLDGGTFSDYSTICMPNIQTNDPSEPAVHSCHTINSSEELSVQHNISENCRESSSSSSSRSNYDLLGDSSTCTSPIALIQSAIHNSSIMDPKIHRNTQRLVRKVMHVRVVQKLAQTQHLSLVEDFCESKDDQNNNDYMNTALSISRSVLENVREIGAKIAYHGNIEQYISSLVDAVHFNTLYKSTPKKSFRNHKQAHEKIVNCGRSEFIRVSRSETPDNNTNFLTCQPPTLINKPSTDDAIHWWQPVDRCGSCPKQCLESSEDSSCPQLSTSAKCCSLPNELVQEQPSPKRSKH